MAIADDPGLMWLLEHGDPAVVALARRDLLGEPTDGQACLASPIVRTLLAGLQKPGALGNPYAKWTGAHWVLVSLVELGIPAGYDVAVAACDVVLDFWAEPARLEDVRVVEGRARQHASQEGNAIAVACRLGLAGDDRVKLMAERLLGWQWPDGGWNCDRHPGASHSSFNETLPALWGLVEYVAATGDQTFCDAIGAAAQLLLEHGLVFSKTSDQPIRRSFIEPHYPPYWHYDLLQALLVLCRAGFADDPRTERARTLLAGRRRPEGTWRAPARWWSPPGMPGSNVEVVAWGDVSHQMITLNALRVGAGR